MAVDADNPCRTCGACCNAFRVSFHWSEASALSPYQVPEHLVTQVSPHIACMAGTQARLPRCAAHRGTVGVSSGCGIYEHRPSPCREVEVGDEKCRRARQLCGLS
ncbi:MAG TPA: YkgJ family cysteine cluster protein [Azonexus sp.]|nr:YkgJ family cysteine cluster protein [Azonexus sp.]